MPDCTIWITCSNEMQTSIVVTFPLLITLFFSFQKFFIEGVTVGSIKG